MTNKALNNDNDDDLTEPLLVTAVAEAPDSLLRTKVWTSIFGCVVAVLSQAILSVVLWEDDILQRSTSSIILFSFHWSFWTCQILFVCMNVALRNQIDNDCIFQVEAQYVVSALLTISAIWIADSIIVAIAVIGALCILVSHLEQSMLSSYSLVAGTLGLIFGSCSQFLLSLGMWNDASMRDPMIHHIILFSIVWSLLTVAMTFAGCVSLRWIVDDDRRAILRMEACYVATTLIGICGAWVFLDISAGLPEQIAPSILMLCVSLGAFGIILQCFPEDACLAEEEEEAIAFVEDKEDIVVQVV